jgi:hypothetical protein
MSHQARSWRMVWACLLVVLVGQGRAWGGEDAPRKAAASARGGQPAIDRLLDEPTELEFIETPLRDVVNYLCDRHGTGILIDTRALEDAGVTPDTPITWNLRGISLRSALNLMLDELELAWLVRRDVLTITTADAARAETIHRVYNVSELMDETSDPPFDAAAIAALTRTMVDAAGCGPAGFGNISHAGQSLLVTHNRFAHELITRMLAELKGARTREFDESVRRASGNRKAFVALTEPSDLDFTETPLSDIVDYLSDLHRLGIQIRNKALEDAGTTSDTPITANIRALSLQDTLETILDELDLTWLVRNETLQITTKEQADGELCVRVYDIADLLGPAHESKKLIQAIVELPVIAEQESSNDGSRGAIRAVPGALVICQSELTHREIEGLLNNLRAKPIQE